MQVTTAIKHLVLAKLQDGIDRAEKRYGRKFVMPTVTYDKGGRVAGTASYSTNTVNFNPILLMQNVATFIARTVPHELAHIIDHTLHPENFEQRLTVTRSGRYKRSKRDVHGESWMSVCYVLGMTDVTRCHNYDVTDASNATGKGAHRYQCARCSKVYVLSTMKHNKMLRYSSSYKCRCNGSIAAIQEGPIVVKKAEVEWTPPAQRTAIVTKPAGGSTKLDKCWFMYKSYSHLGRGALIAMFVSEAGCTVAGAGTYYAACKKKFEAGVL